MPDFGIFRGFNDKLFGDKLYAGQLPINLGMVRSDFIDPDAQAFFDRVNTAGGTLSATEQTAVNYLVLQMKADGIWTKMKAIYPMVGASAAACAQNLKSSSFTGTFNGGVTFSSAGATMNGTSGYLETQLTPNIVFGDEKVSFSTYISDNSSGILIGCVSPFTFDWRFNGFAAAYNNDGPEVIAQKNGLAIVNRNNITELEYKLNNESIQVKTNNYIARSTSSFNIGRLSSLGFYANGTFSFAHIGENLSNQNQTDLYNLVQTFQISLNRSVAP